MKITGLNKIYTSIGFNNDEKIFLKSPLSEKKT